MSYFFLRLDKTAPQNFSFLIDGGATLTASNVVNLTFVTDSADKTGYQVKVWGDVIGANLGATEAVAAWINWPVGGLSVNTTIGDGLKTINARARDRVGNETTAVVRTIIVNSAVPVVTLEGIAGQTIDAPEEIGVSPGATVVSSKQWRFSADVAFVEYQVRVGSTPTFVQTEGVLIGIAGGSINMSGTGTFPANTQITCTLQGADYAVALSNVEGTKVVKVFVKTAAGVWSV